MSLNAQKTRGFSPNVLRRIKLRTRLFVTFLIISLVPVITIGIFSYRAYIQSMNEKVKQAALQTIELLNNNMSTQLGIYSDYIGSISVSDTVQNSRVHIMHIKRNCSGSYLNGPESVLYSIKISFLYRIVLFNLLGIIPSLYHENLISNIQRWNSWNDIMDNLLYRLQK